MSFMNLVCPWCDTHYTFGIVGRQMIGSGHSCKVQRPCEEDGCKENSAFVVVPLDGFGQGRRPPAAVPRLVCAAHREGWAVVMARTGQQS